jgi:hypothetical protein
MLFSVASMFTVRFSKLAIAFSKKFLQETAHFGRGRDVNNRRAHCWFGQYQQHTILTIALRV